LAARTDGLGAAVQVARQAPGSLLGEIRAVTDMPVQAAVSRLPISENLADQITPWVGRGFGNLVTNGFTGRLASIDALLVGAPGLSPQAATTALTLDGINVLDDAAGKLGAVQAAVDAATGEPCP